MVRAHPGIIWLFGFTLAAALALAGCGATSTGTTGNGGYGGGSSAPTATSSSSQSGVVIHTATATVAGKSKTILTNAQGKTLYYFTPDTSTQVACTGGCAQTWPPVLNTSGTPTSASSLPGTLSVTNGANGAQVTYNGHPLYTYTGDSGPGETHGEGVAGKWHVAASDLAPQSGGGSGY